VRAGVTGSRNGRELLTKEFIMSTTLAYPEVELDKIDVVEGFNARSEMDEAELQETAATIRDLGVLQPISVKARDDGRYDLVYGHRRLEAAKLALAQAQEEGADTSGLTKIKVTSCEGDPRLEAFIENEHRSRLNAMDRARGLQALAEEHNLTSNKAIATKVRKTPEWVGAHLRLLRLPEQVQPYVAEGIVPVEGERLLRKIAKVSPEVAAAICEVAKRKKVSGKRFIESFKDLFAESANASIQDRPPMLNADRLYLSEIVAEEEKHRQLAERINTLPSTGYATPDPWIRLSEVEVDAARAAGCLVEHNSTRNGFDTSLQFIIDREFAFDLVVRNVEREEHELEERALKNAGKEAAERDKRKEERKAQRQQALEDKEAARSWNERLGIALLKIRSGARRRRRELAWAKAVALVFMDDNESLAVTGLRLTLRDDMVRVEHKQLKSGKKKEVVTYAERVQCEKELRRRVLAAKSAAEVVQVLAEAMIAAELADQAELPRSKRWGWLVPYRVRNEVSDLLAPDLKEVRPRRTSGKRKQS
jgi:ParB/RepB/Spo0J family partition protein